MSQENNSENRTRLWKFNDLSGNATLMRPEDFHHLTVEYDDQSNEGVWCVYISPEDSVEICDEDAGRLQDFLSQFVVNDFSKPVTTVIQQIGIWKTN